MNTSIQSEAVTVLCSVVNSRISLTRKQPVDGSPDEFTFQFCSNIDSCYNRPDTIEQIPACQLLVRRKEVR